MTFIPATRRQLGVLRSANMNSTADQAVPITLESSTSYRITEIVVTNTSTSLTLAAGGIYTATSKGGTAIVSAVQVYSALTGAAKVLALTLAVTDTQTASSLYLSLTTGQGGAATADVYIYGYLL